MNIIEKINMLNLPTKQFVVLGSAILQIKKIRDCADLDIMVSKDYFEKIKKRHFLAVHS